VGINVFKQLDNFQNSKNKKVTILKVGGFLSLKGFCVCVCVSNRAKRDAGQH